MGMPMRRIRVQRAGIGNNRGLKRGPVQADRGGYQPKMTPPVEPRPCEMPSWNTAS